MVRIRPLLPAPSLHCDNVEHSDGTVTIHVSSHCSSAACPDCGQRSQQVHSRYVRTLADLPWHGALVRVKWENRRLFCKNAACGRRTFTERVPEIAAAYARRTSRLDLALRAIAFACGGAPGARLAERLAMVVSGDSLLRIIRRSASHRPNAARVVGVDDFAFRKGFRYGTLLCDLESRRPIDLLPERSGNSLRDWLQLHPGVEIISRDRGEYYIKGATLGAPQAIQVADRWHLASNLREAVVQWLARSPELWRSLGSTGAKSSVKPTCREPLSTRRRLGAARRQQRLQRYRRCQRLCRQGHTYRAIGQRLGMHANTVRKYLQAWRFPERATPIRRRATDAYLNYLRQRWQEGCHNAQELLLEIKRQGFDGSYDMVRRLVARWRTAPRVRRNDFTIPGVVPPRRVSPDQLAWLLVQRPSRLAAEDLRLISELRQRDAAHAVNLVRQFMEMLRDRSPQRLNGWLARAARRDAPTEIQRFATGLRNDLSAVNAALSLPWSNGQTEGHVNRLKLVKRQMYGRASFDLLRLRFLHAA